MKTSTSHPLQIGTIDLSTGGRIGLTFCPGKVQPGALSGAWDRDLDLDLDAIEAWGAELVLSLVEEWEFDKLQVPSSRFSDGLQQRGICWVHLPIVDQGTPGEEFENEWRRCVGEGLRHRLRVGGSIVLHCKGGLGRTGMIAARLAVELGEMAPEDAITEARRVRPGAIENRAQEDHVRACAPVHDPAWTPEFESSLSRIRGCLLGGAIGDALGAGIEFKSLDQIRRQFGERGARGYVACYGRDVAITDDTQMTLFTVEGICRARIRAALKGGFHPPDVIAFAYRRWLLTQQHALPRDFSPGGDITDGWLFRQRELHSQRAPGNTCLQALGDVTLGSTSHRINDSKGCGGVMRVAPIGFLPSGPEECFRDGCETAALTHTHPTGYLASGVLAALIRGLHQGMTILEALDVARRILRTWDRHEETEHAIEAALQLALEGDPTAEKVERLGGGWIAEEALAIGLYCSLAPLKDPSDDLRERFRERLLLAVNHSGDSDSTGSIAGQILGARDGAACLPHDLLETLESRNIVERLAADQLTLVTESIPGGAEVWCNRYPGC